MGKNDASTLWAQQNLNALAIGRAAQVIQETGRALPCSVTAVDGSLVTVKFEVQGPWTLPPITIPKAESAYLRAPTTVGDVGMTLPADTFLGGVSGQGTGIADLAKSYGNLSTLVFVPVAAVSFSAPPRAGIAWANGPHGARLGDGASAAYVDANPDTGTVTIHAGGNTFIFGAAGFTMSTGIVAETHLHGGVSGGTSDTGPPIA